MTPREITTPGRPYSEAGTTLADARSGRRVVLLTTGAETGGGLAEVEALFPAGSAPSPLREMPDHEIRFEVISGRLEIEIGQSSRVLRAGEALVLPPGTRHRLSVAKEGIGARFLWRVRPALAGEGYFERIFGTPPSNH